MEFLNDVSPNGKQRPWKEKKLRSETVGQAYKGAGLFKKSMRMATCGNVLRFKVVEGGLKLAEALFCQVRLCPICSWRRSLKVANQNRKIVLEANRSHKLRWIFVTLTGGQTVPGEDLSDRVTHMMDSFNRLTKYKAVSNPVLGFFRGLEITKSKGKYHPHFHVLLAVKPSYFTRDYIKQDDWVRLWQKALKTSDKVVVDVRTVKPNEKHKKLTTDEIQAYEGALQEVSKYAVKDSDLVQGTPEENAETVHFLDAAMLNRRLIGYGGILKDIRKQLQLQDVESSDLIHIDDDNKEDEIADHVEYVTAFWNYGLKNYVIE